MKKLLMTTFAMAALTLSTSALATGGGKTVDPSVLSGGYTGILIWLQPK